MEEKGERGRISLPSSNDSLRAQSSLKRWAVIDIETTGIDPLFDDIIDVGFLQFEGVNLIRKYRSLVRSKNAPSFFIQKLTGISEEMLRKAPLWREVSLDVMDLFGHHLIAHNADFEKSFLAEHFEESDDGEKRESYEDSMPFLGLLFPQRKSLKLESFIVDWEIAEGEVHRGLEDSVDLLKVLIIAVKLIRENRELRGTLNTLFAQYSLQDYWYYHFFNLYDEELEQLAQSIDFNWKEVFERAKNFEKVQREDRRDYDSTRFGLDFRGDNIKEILRDEEIIREKMPGYRYRNSQERMSLRLGQSFKNNVHALVQAPTGTGKTMGYLIPSALFSLSEKRQVLVATGTKALQHQAMTKDIPLLRELLGLGEEKLVVKRLVGSANHLCELLFRQDSADEEDLILRAQTFEEKFSALYFDLVFYHNAKASNENWILKEDLPFVFRKKFESFKERQDRVSVDFRSCTGGSCPFRGDCTYLRGLREAKSAHIIIGNHALMYSWPRTFPRPEYIIVDEAHKIEEETTRAFALEASQKAFETLGRSLKNAQGVGALFFLLSQRDERQGSSGSSTEIINEIRKATTETYYMMMDHLQVLPDLFERYFKKMPRYTEFFWNELPMVSEKDGQDPLGIGLFNHLESLHYILTNYRESLSPYSSLFEGDLKNLENEQEVIALTRFTTFQGQIDDLLSVLKTSLSQKKGFSHTLRFHEKEGYLLYSAPIDIGETTFRHLLETARSVFFTSATLGNALGDQGLQGVEWVTGYGHLPAEKRFQRGLFLPAPYDYKKKAKVYLCDDTLPLYEGQFVQRTMEKIIPLIRDIRGRTLLLFSAKKRFELAREILLKKLDGEIPIFVQGMGPHVVEDFKLHGNGVLLGMESFGEGIDIPGEALSFIFIDKIPDLRMDKVINDRRHFYESHIGNEFTDYYLSHRTRALHQKLGRLLRTESDRGGALIVDSRIRRWKGRTMEKFNKLMEPYTIQRTSLEMAIQGISQFLGVSEISQTFESSQSFKEKKSSDGPKDGGASLLI